MSSILTNTGAMVALQTLRGVNQGLSTVQDQISTGKKVGTAKDNAAIWAISKVMESDVQGFRGIRESLSLGQSSVTVARTATESVADLLTDIKGKIVSAQESNVDRAKIQADISQMRDQIRSVIGTAQFNGLNLVDNNETVNILSSLDRAPDGSVTAGNIAIAGQDLRLGATAGTIASAELLDSAAVAGLSAGATGDLQAAANLSFIMGGGVESQDEDVEFTLAVTDPGDPLDLGPGGVDIALRIGGASPITVNVTYDEPNANGLGDAVANAINARMLELGLEDSIEASFAGGTLTVETTDLANEVIVDLRNLAAADPRINVGPSEVQTIAQSQVPYDDAIIVNGVELNVELTSGMDAEQVATAIEAAIAASDDPALTGVVLQRSGDVLTFTNATGDDVAVDLAAIEARIDGDILGAGVTGGEGTIGSQAATVTFDSADVVLAGGDTYSLTLGSGNDARTFSFTLQSTPADTPEGREAAFAEIAAGLAAEINATSAETGFFASADEGVFTVGNANGTAQAFTLEATTGGRDAGRLAALEDIDVSTREGAVAALEEIEGLIQTAIDASAAFGSAQSRIDNQSEFITRLSDALKSGIGTLVDADMEEASARLQALQVQQQLAIQSLSIANQAPQNILSLFR